MARPLACHKLSCQNPVVCIPDPVHQLPLGRWVFVCQSARALLGVHCALSRLLPSTAPFAGRACRQKRSILRLSLPLENIPLRRPFGSSAEQMRRSLQAPVLVARRLPRAYFRPLLVAGCPRVPAGCAELHPGRPVKSHLSTAHAPHAGHDETLSTLRGSALHQRWSANLWQRATDSPK